MTKIQTGPGKNQVTTGFLVPTDEKKLVGELRNGQSI